MKALFFTAFAMCSMLVVQAQNETDKPKPKSPPAVAKATIASGTEVTIDYSQPSVKGRVIGENLEPKKGEVWRAGANATTIFEVSKDVTINGKKLPAGKYGFFTIDNGDNWTIIFNKVWKDWGAYKYKESEDALRITVPAKKDNTPFTETLTYAVNKSGEVNLLWGGIKVGFVVK